MSHSQNRSSLLVLLTLLLQGCATKALWQTDARLFAGSTSHIATTEVRLGDCHLRIPTNGRTALLIANDPERGCWLLHAGHTDDLMRLLKRALPEDAARTQSCFLDVELTREWLDGELVESAADVTASRGAAGGEASLAGAQPVTAFGHTLTGSYRAHLQARELANVPAPSADAGIALWVTVRVVDHHAASVPPMSNWQRAALTPITVAFDCIVIGGVGWLLGSGLEALSRAEIQIDWSRAASG